MASTASSSASPNIPYRWRRKVYMNANHTITKFNPVDGASAPPSAPANPTTGPSTGPHTRAPQNKVNVSAPTESVQAPTDGNSDQVRCQELMPNPSSMSAPPSVVPVYIIDCEQVAGQLKYMQRRMKDGWIANGEQAEEKENVAPSPRPRKRKRAATGPTPGVPVRQSKRLQRKRQGRDKE